MADAKVEEVRKRALAWIERANKGLKRLKERE